jgi:hypothetical protein
MYDVIYCGGRFLAVNLDGTVNFSIDGLSWQTSTIPTAFLDFNSVACRPG